MVSNLEKGLKEQESVKKGKDVCYSREDLAKEMGLNFQYDSSVTGFSKSVPFSQAPPFFQAPRRIEHYK